MAWIGVAIGTSALMSYENNQAAKERDKKNMLANAAQMQYSPWTHAQVQMEGPKASTSDIGALGSGALSGAMTGIAVNKAMGSSPSATPSSQPSAQAGDLGAKDMSAQLGKQAQDFQATTPNSWQPQPQPGQPSAWGQMAQTPGDPYTVAGKKKLNFFNQGG